MRVGAGRGSRTLGRQDRPIGCPTGMSFEAGWAGQARACLPIRLAACLPAL